MEITINQRLKEFRKVKKMSQEEIGNALGLKQTSYSDIERGKSSLTESILSRLITLYSISPTWLYTGKGNMLLSEEAEGESENVLSENILEINKPTNANELIQINTLLAEKDKLLSELAHLHTLISEKDKLITEKDARILLLEKICNLQAT